MTNRKMFCIMGVAAVCLPLLSGCGGNKGSDTATTTTTNGGQAMLNNPNIPEADKEKIRKSMGTGAAPGGAAGSGGAAASDGAKSGQ